MPFVAQLSELDIVIISGNRQADEFMRAADLFEPFKVLANPEIFHLKLNPEKQFKADKTVEVLKKSYEEFGNRVVAIFFPSVHAPFYLDPDVKVISNGRQWSMLKDVLDHYNFVEKS